MVPPRPFDPVRDRHGRPRCGPRPGPYVHLWRSPQRRCRELPVRCRKPHGRKGFAGLQRHRAPAMAAPLPLAPGRDRACRNRTAGRGPPSQRRCLRADHPGVGSMATPIPQVAPPGDGSRAGPVDVLSPRLFLIVHHHRGHLRPVHASRLDADGNLLEPDRPVEASGAGRAVHRPGRPDALRRDCRHRHGNPHAASVP